MIKLKALPVAGAGDEPPASNERRWRRVVEKGIALRDAAMQVLTARLAPISSTDARLETDRPFMVPTYAVSGAPSAADAGAGALIRVSNGNSGAPCLAMSDGTNWKRIVLGADIAP